MDYISELSPVTVWFRLNRKTDEFEHNHVEDGHMIATEPFPINDFQKKAWKGCLWQYEHRYITFDYKLVF